MLALQPVAELVESEPAALTLVAQRDWLSVRPVPVQVWFGGESGQLLLSGFGSNS